MGRTYDLDDLSEEWQAVLHEIDDRLFQVLTPCIGASLVWEHGSRTQALSQETHRASWQ